MRAQQAFVKIAGLRKWQIQSEQYLGGAGPGWSRAPRLSIIRRADVQRDFQFAGGFHTPPTNLGTILVGWAEF